MNRGEMLGHLESGEVLDVLVIGGGATGLGCAVDAASRGHRTGLLEAHDFAKGTSSRSTKLVHGGVRYLQQGNVSLVLEALRERGILCRNAPHLVHDLAFVVPRYRWWEGPFYGVGLKMYDALARDRNIAPSRLLSREETLREIPNVEPSQLLGGVRYHDAQFDDARMAVSLARTAVMHGAAVLNHARMVELVKEGGQVTGAVALDTETGRELRLRARVVINATGSFSDAVRRLDDPGAASTLAHSQGVHVVLDRSFQPSRSAIMVPRTDDGRVLFVIPWHDRVLVGTTDTPVDDPSLEPRALPEEIDFLLENAGRYLAHDPKRDDVLSVFAGLRPLVQNGDPAQTKRLSREHTVLVSPSGLVTIVGGKWTTYRKMAQDTIDDAEGVGGLAPRRCVTEGLAIHGWMERSDPDFPAEGSFQMYGSEHRAVRALAAAAPGSEAPLHPRLPYQRLHVLQAVRHELACTLEDVLARRTRSLLLDARASIEAAPAVAAILAAELGRDADWRDAELARYRALAEGYLLPGATRPCPAVV
jgi:glycerol-3-phosphate dehydrogenase